MPPTEASPRTLWMWMNGNITSNGITLDLEAMKRVGLGGALVFNIGEYIPKGPVDYGSSEWLDLMTHAAKECDRLGLQLAMHNCPGWSSSGGPWITPEKSMQQLVWTETHLAGPGVTTVTLPHPFENLGYYRDIVVLAFPSLPGDEHSYAETVTRISVGNQTVDPDVLTDGDFKTRVIVSPESPLVFEFAEPFEARAVSVFRNAGGSSMRFTLEAGDDGQHFTNVARLTPPNPRAIEDAPMSATFKPVRARFFRLVPSRRREVLEAQLDASPRIPGWEYLADYTYRAAQPAKRPAEVPSRFVINPDQVVDLTRKMDAEDRLTWEVPAGSWTILRFGYTARGQQNIAAPDAGVGLECDKLSRAGIEFHFERGIQPLLDRLGPLVGKTFTGLDVDSYEVGMQTWTAGFENDFKQRNGYDLLPYLPAMTGRYVGSTDVSQRFLWDIRRTYAEMVADNYYGRFRELCNERGLDLYVEPYGAGPGPYDELQVAGRADVPLGEFWAHLPWDDTPSVKLAASAAHIHGRRIVGAESFTAMEEQSRFLDYPYALKSLGDLAFSLGLNQMYFHRWAHQPHPTAVPGMTMGPWGFQFERNVTWFEQSPAWLNYLARCQFMLRQGGFVADVLYFTGEGSPQLSRQRTPKLPPGYDCDACNTEVLLTARVKDGRIMLPGGMSYRLLALPDDMRSMTPNVLRCLSELVKQGATVVGPQPQFSPSLRGFPKSDIEVARMADKLWQAKPSATGTHANNTNNGSKQASQTVSLSSASSGGEGRGEEESLKAAPLSSSLPTRSSRGERGTAGAAAQIHRQGGVSPGEGEVRGKVFPSQPIGDVLEQLQIPPDFTFSSRNPDASLVWLHRRTDSVDFYFVANRQRRGEDLVCTFRIAGKQPEFWQPETGERRRAATYDIAGGRTQVPMHLEPAESRFVVFRASAENQPVRWLACDGEKLLDTIPFHSSTAEPATHIANTFTITAWIKPDTDLLFMPRESVNGKMNELGKSWILPATEVDSNSDTDEARLGIAAGRNGVVVVERTPAGAAPVLVSRTPISGWTHLAVVYHNGKPALYLNGHHDRDGLTSRRAIRVNLHPPLPIDKVINYFDGDLTGLHFEAKPLDDGQIETLASAEVPPSPLPEPIVVSQLADGRVEALIWHPGFYALEDGRGVNVRSIPAPRTLHGPWQVGFQPHRGAPESAVLPELISLQDYADPGVRYFSGMATYMHEFNLAAGALSTDRRWFLDLGRVAVTAEVLVNGRSFGIQWKPPFRVDITDALVAGTNRLEVRVANLWVNRLIGDERLPVENEYSPRNHAIERLPDWYVEGRPKPSGGRTTFCTWQFFQKDDPLVESGLLGPVRLLAAERRVFDK